jgi:hypothetical protein
MLRRAISHVTGIVNIAAEEFEAMPPQFAGAWLRGHFRKSPSRWIASSTRSRRNPGRDHRRLQIIRSLYLYRARNSTNRALIGPAARQASRRSRVLWSATGDGSPYFQSISLGFECAMCLAGLLEHARHAAADLLERL